MTMDVRSDFPILDQKINGRNLIYLDNAAATQVPLQVLKRLEEHYTKDNANIHRGIHSLSERSTSEYEKAREKVAAFINAADPNEVVFTSGTTDSINTICRGLEYIIDEEDSIVVSALEHHSNFLPWQRLARMGGAYFDIIPCPDGNPDMDSYEALLEESPKIVALTHVSNLTGTIFPIKMMTEMAHEAGALVVIDGAQGIRHELVDVQDIDCDFYCFSGHKIMAPSGIGVLYGKKESLEKLVPMKLGGGMVDLVNEDSAIYNPLPARLEAGTPNISGAIALGAALDYIETVGRKEICKIEGELIKYAEERLSSMPEIEILGHPKNRAGVISFNITGVHPYDAATMLDKMGVALRSGTHCAQPALYELGEEYALRLSPAFYNTKEEIDEACICIRKTAELF